MYISRDIGDSASWESIANGVTRINVRDKVHFKLTDGRAVTAVCVADSPYEPNTLIFHFDEAIERRSMNRRNTNGGAWEASGMRLAINSETIQFLPEELRSIIVPRTIKQNINGNIIQTCDLLWLPSVKEVFGNDRNFETEYGATDEGDVPFAGFQSARDRVRNFENGAGTWWLRSPYLGNTTSFWLVYTSGYVSSYHASYVYGVVPCFSISYAEEEIEDFGDFAMFLGS